MGSARWRRLVGWALLGPLLLALALVALGATAVAWLRTEAGNDWLLAELLPKVQPPNGRVELASLRTDLFTHAEATGFAIRDAKGTELLGADSVQVSFSAQSLLARTLPVSNLEISGFRLNLDDPAELGNVWGSPSDSPKPWGGLPFDLHLGRIGLHGQARIGEWQAENVDISASASVVRTRVTWEGMNATAQLRSVPISLKSSGVWQSPLIFLKKSSVSIGESGSNFLSFAGSVEKKGDMALWVSHARLTRATLLPLIPQLEAVPIEGPLDLSAWVDGTLAAPDVTFSLTTPGGPLTGFGSINLETKVWRASVVTPGFALDHVVEGAPAVGLSGTLDADGTGYRWPDELEGTVKADLVAEVKGETVHLAGPFALASAVITSPGAFVLDAGWASVRGTTTTDVLAKKASVHVDSASAELSRLSRYGVPPIGGLAGFVGDVTADWAAAPAATANGEMNVRNVRFEGAEIDRAAGGIAASWDGAINASGDLVLAGVRYQGRSAGAGTAKFSIGQEITFDVGLSEPDRGILATAGSFSQASRALTISSLRAELAPGLQLETSGVQRARFTAGGVSDVALDATVAGAHVTASGGFTDTARDTLIAEVSNFDLSFLDRIAPGKFGGWAGIVDVRAGVNGNLRGFSTEGELTSVNTAIPGSVKDVDLHAVWNSDEHGFDATATAGAQGRDRLSGHFLLPLGLSRAGLDWRMDEPLAVSAVLPPTALRDLEAMLDGRTLPELTASAAVSLGGTLRNPTGSWTASADLPISPTGTTVRIWSDGTLDSGELFSRTVVNQAFQSRLELTVGAPIQHSPLLDWLSGESSTPGVGDVVGELGGAIVLKQFPIATLQRLTDARYDLDGSLSGAFAISGKPTAPHLQGGINVLAARIGPVRVEPATFSLTPFGPGYRVEASLGFLPTEAPGAESLGARLAQSSRPPPAACGDDPNSAGSIEISGFVPLNDALDRNKPGLSLQVTGRGIPLSTVEGFTTSIRDSGGCLSLSGDVTGTLASPELALGVALSNGGLSLLPLGVRYDEMSLHGRFQENLLTLDDFHAENHPLYGGYELRELDAGKGKVEGAAQVQFDGFLPNRIEGKLDLSGAWLIATADKRAQASGTLLASGTGRELGVEGNLTVDNAYLDLRERFFASANTNPLHPDIEIIRPGQTIAVADQAALPAFNLSIRPKVTLDLARHVRMHVALPLQGAYGDVARSLSTVEVDTELDGTLKVDHKGGDLRLTGEVTPEDARATILGRPFAVSEGTIAFTGVDFKDPLLDLAATYTSTDYGDIQVAIGGSARDPTLAFTSDELSEDDVLSVLVLGAPIADLGKSNDSGASASDQASAQALAVVTSVLRSELEEGLSSTFRLESVDIQDGVSVSLALGKNVYLTTQYNIVEDQTDENVFEVDFEVSLPYRWYLEVGTGDRGISHISALRKWRF